MRARLKSLRSDAITDLPRWRPPVSDEFAVPVVLEVGPLGLRGRERFDLLVVTPRWLLAHHGAEGAVLGRGLLLVFAWSYEGIRAFLARQVEACSGETWPEVARQVGRLADWEGEGAEIVPLR
jgi:hypothetical protein